MLSSTNRVISPACRRGSALRVKTKADIERQLGAEFQSFNLDGLTVEKVFNAAATYRKAEEKVAKRIEAIQSQLRALTLAPGAAGPAGAAEAAQMSGKVVPTAGAAAAAPVAAAVAAVGSEASIAAAPERSLVDKIMWGQKGPPAPEAAAMAVGGEAAPAGPGMKMPFGGGGGVRTRKGSITLPW